LLATTLSACGGTARSVAAFCATLAKEKQEFLATYDNTNQPPLQALIKGLASIGEIPVIFDKLDKVAPADIEPDVAQVRDNFKQQISQLGGVASNPLGGLAAGLFSSLVAAGTFLRVSNYIAANCPGQGSAR
jgi:hypothetical protein